MSDYYKLLLAAENNQQRLGIVIKMLSSEVVSSKEFLEYIFVDDRYKNLNIHVLHTLIEYDSETIDHFQAMAPEDFLPSWKQILADIEKEIPIGNISFPWTEEQYSTSKKLLSSHFEFNNETILPRILKWNEYDQHRIKELRVEQIYRILLSKMDIDNAIEYINSHLKFEYDNFNIILQYGMGEYALSYSYFYKSRKC